MKHPVGDRILILLCALAALCGAAGSVMLLMGRISVDTIAAAVAQINMASLLTKAIIVLVGAAFIALFLLLIGMTLPAGKKRSSNYAIQRNENGMVRISLKALDTLVKKCLDEHAELKVVNSSLFSDEESIRVDVHIALQSDISMPLAISALQKQIKKYLEACSGVMVQEVRIFVDSTIPSDEETTKSPYAIPADFLGLSTENQLQEPKEEEKKVEAAAEAVELETAVSEDELSDAEPAAVENFDVCSEEQKEELPEEQA